MPLATKHRHKKLATSASWKKGQSGNPNGAPKKAWRWSEVLRSVAEKIDRSGKEFKELAAEALLKEAMKGNIAALRELGDRLEGKPRQSIEITPLEEKKVMSLDVAFRAAEVLKKRNIELRLTHDEWAAMYRKQETASSKT